LLQADQLPLERALATGTVVDAQLIVRRPSDGQDVFIRESAAPLRDAAGKVSGALAVFTDVTPQRKLLLELASKEQLFRAMIENSSDLSMLVDAEGRVIFDTPAVQRVLGYPKEALLGQRLFDHVHPDDVASCHQVFQQILANPDQSFEMSVRVRHADGSWRYLDAVGLNLLDEPAVGAIVGNMRDVTEKRLAEEIQKSRSRALEEERERIAMDLHDGVIQSLYSVVLSLGATRRGSDNSQASLSAAIEHINSVIGELRSYIYDLRPTSGETIDLCGALEVLAKELVPKKGAVRLRLDLPRQLGSAIQAKIVEETLQVAREALSNVVRHAAAAHVSVALTVDDGRIRLTIKDDGMGFETVAAGRRQGDGLRNMYQRANAMDGDLAIDSQRGAGTTLRLTVPLPAV
jgi:PAS domain S-box-containing protein